MEKWLKKVKRFFTKFAKTKQSHILLAIILVLGFFIPRYLANLKYTALEDELLSIHFNLVSSITYLMAAPDHAHPPLWYILMEQPTQVLGLNHGIFYYRALQVLILFLLLSLSFCCFKKKLPFKLVVLFFAFFLTNIYLVHLSFQHRMYAMVLGWAVLYSFYWYYLIKQGKDQSFIHFILLALIAVLGFFTNYSIVWLIPIWPLSYLLYRRTFAVFKRLLVFISVFIISTIWFLPTLIFNIDESIYGNTFYPTINFVSILNIISDYFGILKFGDLSHVNFLFVIFIAIFLSVVAISCYVYKKSYLRVLTFSTLIFFFLFLAASDWTGGRIFYARTSIPFVIAAYFILVELYSLNKDRYFRALIYFLILIQMIQFVFYFSNKKRISGQYDVFNYRVNPMLYFRSYAFGKNDCLIPIPDWNKVAITYYIGDLVKIITAADVEQQGKQVLDACSHVYVLDQTTVDRNIADHQLQQIDKENKSLIEIKKYQNQSLYLLRNDN